MKNFSIKCIRIYQKIPGPWHLACRHNPTCSNYAVEAISRYGFWKGWYLAIIRLLKCNPFGTSGYDPVPIKEK